MGGTQQQQRLLAGRYFNHTHISVYLVGTFAVACVLYDSTHVRKVKRTCMHSHRKVFGFGSVLTELLLLLQGFLQRYALNKKWYYLYGAKQQQSLILF